MVALIIAIVVTGWILSRPVVKVARAFREQSGRGA